MSGASTQACINRGCRSSSPGSTTSLYVDRQRQCSSQPVSDKPGPLEHQYAHFLYELRGIPHFFVFSILSLQRRFSPVIQTSPKSTIMAATGTGLSFAPLMILAATILTTVYFGQPWLLSASAIDTLWLVILLSIRQEPVRIYRPGPRVDKADTF